MQCGQPKTSKRTALIRSPSTCALSLNTAPCSASPALASMTSGAGGKRPTLRGRAKCSTTISSYDMPTVSHVPGQLSIVPARPPKDTTIFSTAARVHGRGGVLERGMPRSAERVSMDGHPGLARSRTAQRNGPRRQTRRHDRRDRPLAHILCSAAFVHPCTSGVRWVVFQRLAQNFALSDTPKICGSLMKPVRLLKSMPPVTTSSSVMLRPKTATSYLSPQL